MKSHLLSLLLTFSYLFSGAYTWIPFGPDTLHATQCRFGITMGMGVICSPYGICIYEDDMEWHFYETGLPVTDAAYKGPTEMLVAMGSGSYSDGIYTFNLTTHEFEIAEWMINPNFIHLVPVLKKDGKFVDQYFAGGQFSGLISSVDGETWWNIDYFNGKSCSVMDYYNEHLVISEVSNIHNIYYSNDYGVSWSETSTGTPMLTDLKFNFEGYLYGVFPYYSNSSGLYRSEDFGATWEVEFWSDEMNAVGFDAMSNLFVGWKSDYSDNEGIALYDPDAPSPGFTFLNEGLPNLHINQIMMNPTMSAIAIFCCTDAGVYMSYDYLMAEKENAENINLISLFPNPLDNSRELTIRVAVNDQIRSINLFTAGGRHIMKIHQSDGDRTGNYHVDISVLNAGVYFIKIQTERSSVSRKILIR